VARARSKQFALSHVQLPAGRIGRRPAAGQAVRTGGGVHSPVALPWCEPARANDRCIMPDSDPTRPRAWTAAASERVQSISAFIDVNDGHLRWLERVADKRIQGGHPPDCPDSCAGKHALYAAEAARRLGIEVPATMPKMGTLLSNEAKWFKALSRAAEAKARRIAKPRTKRRRTAAVRPLTTLQQQAVSLYAKYNGRIIDIAREMGVTHTTVNQHLKAAWRKLPDLAPKKIGPAGKARRLPTDKRGQVDVSDD